VDTTLKHKVLQIHSLCNLYPSFVFYFTIFAVSQDHIVRTVARLQNHELGRFRVCYVLVQLNAWEAARHRDTYTAYDAFAAEI
jgi:hypothetical protein